MASFWYIERTRMLGIKMHEKMVKIENTPQTWMIYVSINVELALDANPDLDFLNEILKISII